MDKKGFVYIMTNDSMPDLIKVGMTTKIPTERAKELEGTGHPKPFVVQYCALFDDMSLAEKNAHLALFRYRDGKEFFKVDVTTAIRCIEDTGVPFTRVHCKPDDDRKVKEQKIAEKRVAEANERKIAEAKREEERRRDVIIKRKKQEKVERRKRLHTMLNETFSVELRARVNQFVKHIETKELPEDSVFITFRELCVIEAAQYLNYYRIEGEFIKKAASDGNLCNVSVGEKTYASYEFALEPIRERLQEVENDMRHNIGISKWYKLRQLIIHDEPYREPNEYVKKRVVWLCENCQTENEDNLDICCACGVETTGKLQNVQGDAREIKELEESQNYVQGNNIIVLVQFVASLSGGVIFSLLAYVSFRGGSVGLGIYSSFLAVFCLFGVWVIKDSFKSGF